MRTLVHLSDLHFGRTDPAVLEPLLAFVAAAEPHCVVISGDLTQRAKPKEFQEARAFLDRLPGPQVVVPGNHDVPLYRIWERFLNPLGNYRKYIGPHTETSFCDDEIAVIGVNTARSLTFKGGRINEEQIESIRQRLAGLPPHTTRIVVTHHPFDLPGSREDDKLVGRAGKAMAAFSSCGVDLLLAGHFHTSQAGDTAERYDLAGYAALAVQAGTATSTRSRGEANSFNVLQVEIDAVAVERHLWDPVRAVFGLDSTERFTRHDDRWLQSPAPA